MLKEGDAGKLSANASDVQSERNCQMQFKHRHLPEAYDERQSACLTQPKQLNPSASADSIPNTVENPLSEASSYQLPMPA